MIKLLSLILILFSLGCASTKKIKNANQSVNLGDIEQSLEGDNSSASEPEELSLDEKNKISVQDPKWGIYLTPAGAFSFGYFDVLDVLAKHKITINAVGGAGETALVAGLYAKYRNKNIIQWKIYNLQQRLKEHKKWLGPDWIDEVFAFIDKEFKNDRIEHFKIRPILPYLAGDKILVPNKGKIKDAIKRSFRFGSDKQSFLLANNERPSILFNKIKLDVVREISLMPDKIDFDYPDDYIWGIYSRISGLANQNIWSVKFLVDNFPIDRILEYNLLKDIVNRAIDSKLSTILEIQSKAQNF